jgi:hypothetical protein
MSGEYVCSETLSLWQARFLAMLPEIQQRLRYSFRRLDAASREEAIAEGVLHAMLSFLRLHERRRSDAICASSLAWYAALAVKQGRPAAGHMNSKEPFSQYAQLRRGFQMEKRPSDWLEQLVEDKRASVPDQVAAKVDFGAWFAGLSRHMRQIAKDLAIGFSTSEAAKKHGVTAGRISQLRRLLETSWMEFQSQVSVTLER